MTKERIEKLLKAGANVVLTTKGIDDMALKARFYFTYFLPYFSVSMIDGGLFFQITLHGGM